MNTRDVLQEITRRIVAVSDPEQIVLFGSHARGQAGPDSDIDVLVIAQGITSPRQESVRIQRALRGLLVPVDVVVVTPQQLDTYRDAIGLVYRSALREGKVLYERASGS
jgi:predicted nucleotidyltransferase